MDNSSTMRTMIFVIGGIAALALILNFVTSYKKGSDPTFINCSDGRVVSLIDPSSLVIDYSGISFELAVEKDQLINAKLNLSDKTLQKAFEHTQVLDQKLRLLIAAHNATPCNEENSNRISEITKLHGKATDALVSIQRISNLATNDIVDEASYNREKDKLVTIIGD